VIYLSKIDNDTLKWHEKMAKASFNKTWEYLDKNDRNPSENAEMIHVVHASRYHWGVLVSNGKGQPVNLQRGEWQVSRVYTVLEMPEPALYHAKLCLKLTEDNNIGDFDLAFAHEALARAFALSGKKVEYEKHSKLAEEYGNQINKKEDKEYFFEDFNGGKWFGMR
jgi:hypothetical protein